MQESSLSGTRVASALMSLAPVRYPTMSRGRAAVRKRTVLLKTSARDVPEKNSGGNLPVKTSGGDALEKKFRVATTTDEVCASLVLLVNSPYQRIWMSRYNGQVEVGDVVAVQTRHSTVSHAHTKTHTHTCTTHIYRQNTHHAHSQFTPKN